MVRCNLPAGPSVAAAGDWHSSLRSQLCSDALITITSVYMPEVKSLESNCAAWRISKETNSRKHETDTFNDLQRQAPPMHSIAG
jgi:hypothetical protein